ncbi:MAG: hypothetical protein DIU65_17195, partial [Proteobacteria bacterium]
MSTQTKAEAGHDPRHQVGGQGPAGVVEAASANGHTSTQVEYRLLPVSALEPFAIRDIRPAVCERLRERIAEGGYNPARPITVVPTAFGDRYLVADGNHRLVVLKELGIDVVPCVVRREDPYALAIRCNEDEETYAPMDLFDWLDVIRRLRDEEPTQARIAERIGWSREQVRDYVRLSERVGAEVLDLAKRHQEGRAPMDGANAPAFNFTEGWFRTSGLYDLPAKYQLRLMEAFIADKCRWTKDKVQKEAAKYRRWMEFAKIAEAELVNSDDLEGVIQLIESDAFQTEAQLRRKIADLNNEAQNRLYCGDAVHVLEELPDGCIDIVITDPPYGIDYHSNRSQYSDHITRQGIANDELHDALATFDAVCARLARKTKPDAHMYVFVGWQTEPQFRAIVEKHGFTVRNILIWDKGNHGAGDLRYAWANRYEMIIFATKGTRPLNKRMDDIIPVPKIP